MDSVRKTMQEAVGQGIFPGAVLLCARHGKIRFHEAFGTACLETGRPVTIHTWFDLASLTKPLATACCFLVLASFGELSVDAPLGKLLPPLTGTPREGVTLAQTLAHTAGYPEYKPYHEELFRLPSTLRVPRLRALLAHEPLEYPPGEKTVYGDPAYMVLQWVLERILGKPLDAAARKLVFRPLGIRALDFSPPASAAVAATEKDPETGEYLQGVVHDENARALGGVAGHAGLFGTAAGVCALVSALLAAFHGWKNPVFDPDAVRDFLTRKPGPGGHVLGFDTPTRPHSSSGAWFGDRSVGHLGFTGTSFWADLDTGTVVVLLTNRVHPSRENDGIRAFRPLIHDRVMEALARIIHEA
ncbi:MAG: beta-lactamase family protein [Deltaproteobacteria bacterium]|nr:beta-lactamase family protein [Deltaproteobacteria bacterium]